MGAWGAGKEGSHPCLGRQRRALLTWGHGGEFGVHLVQQGGASEVAEEGVEEIHQLHLLVKMAGGDLNGAPCWGGPLAWRRRRRRGRGADAGVEEEGGGGSLSRSTSSLALVLPPFTTKVSVAERPASFVS